jgi:hypothetical protein
MESTTSSFEAMARKYPFGDFDLIVDVGGGGGGLLVAVLERYARPRGIVFDLPSEIAGVHQSFLPVHVAGRLDFVAGDLPPALLSNCVKTGGALGSCKAREGPPWRSSWPPGVRVFQQISLSPLMMTKLVHTGVRPSGSIECARSLGP